MNFIQFFRFGVVGAFGLCIDFCVTWVLKEKVRVNKYQSNAIGFVVAATNNYFLNKYFTFQNTDSDLVIQFASFFGIALVGLGLNLIILYCLQTYTKSNFYISKIIATAIVFLWNFTANSWFTFN
jgi:putative flippase GtrA|nr:GtrA family protein [uncultured Flavobacterium sp.]